MNTKQIKSELIQLILIFLFTFSLLIVSSCEKEKKQYKTISCELKSIDENLQLRVKSTILQALKLNKFCVWAFRW